MITIISDRYLKSRACTFEVGELIKDHDFQKKIIFIILSDNDKIYYKSEINESIQAEIYDPKKHINYILYWQEEYKIYEENIKQIDSEIARTKSMKYMSEIKKIIDYDLGDFLCYLADAKGLSLSELIASNFAEIIYQIKK